MSQPTPDSISLVQGFMDNEKEPLTLYLARLVGEVNLLNWQVVSALLEERRPAFESAGAGALLQDLERELRETFAPFLNREDDGVK